MSNVEHATSEQIKLEVLETLEKEDFSGVFIELPNPEQVKTEGPDAGKRAKLMLIETNNTVSFGFGASMLLESLVEDEDIDANTKLAFLHGYKTLIEQVIQEIEGDHNE